MILKKLKTSNIVFYVNYLNQSIIFQPKETKHQTKHIIMPFGSRSMTLNARMEKKSDSPSAPIIPAGVIVGSAEWARYKGFTKPKKSKKPARTEDDDLSLFSVKDMPHKFSSQKHGKNETLLSKIANWTYKNDWQMIDDPSNENNRKWVNKNYPNKLFECGRIDLEVAPNKMDFELFPLSDYADDPLGIACHFVISGDGQWSTVQPNRWVNHDSTRKGRKGVRINIRRERGRARAEEFQKIEKQFKTYEEREAARSQLLRKFHQEDVQREQAEMMED